MISNQHALGDVSPGITSLMRTNWDYIPIGEENDEFEKGNFPHGAQRMKTDYRAVLPPACTFSVSFFFVKPFPHQLRNGSAIPLARYPHLTRWSVLIW